MRLFDPGRRRGESTGSAEVDRILTCSVSACDECLLGCMLTCDDDCEEGKGWRELKECLCDSGARFRGDGLSSPPIRLVSDAGADRGISACISLL